MDEKKRAIEIKMPLRSMDAAVIKDLQEKYPEAEVSLNIHPERGQSPMSESYFWEIVDMLDWDQMDDDQAILEPAIQHLAGGSVRHIFEFTDLLSEK